MSYASKSRAFPHITFPKHALKNKCFCKRIGISRICTTKFRIKSVV